jgi:hypothetical protein
MRPIFEGGEIIFYAILFLIFIFYAYAFKSFFDFNSLWIILCFGYVIYFIWEDNYMKLKSVENRIRFVESKNRRIDFWN